MSGLASRIGRPAFAIGLAAVVSVILFLALGPWTRGPGSSSDKTFDVGAAKVDIDVQPDASLRVTEHLHFRYSGDDFTGAYRDIALTPNTELTDVGISDGPDGTYAPGGNTALGSEDGPGLFGTESIDGGERIVWHYDQQHGGTRDFALGYRAIGATDAYDDVVHVHWAIWGDQWQFALPKLAAALTLSAPASGDGKPLRVWLEPGHLATEPTTGATGASVDVDRVPPGTQVVLSAIYPRAAFSSVDAATLHVGDARAALEREADAAEPGGLDRLGDWLWVHAVIASLIAAAIVAAILALVLWRARERPTGVAEYLPGPPSDAIPAVGHGLATEGIYSNRVVLATLLDLADRGFYLQSAGEGDPKLKRLDLLLEMAPDRPGSSTLTKPERAVLSFFDDLIGEARSPLSELKTRIPKHSEEWRGRWTEMNRLLEDQGKQELEWDLDLRWARFALIGAALVLFGIIGGAGIERAEDGYIPLIGFVLTLGAVAAPRAESFRRLAPESREPSAQWQAFAKWTHDFPRLSDDPPATLTLWKRILVFGVAFGTAQRVIDSGRIPESIMSSPEFVASTGAYAFMGDGDYAAGFGSAMSSQVAAQSSSGAGGGGGGGSSGGGGGGAW